jgi:NADP-dependent 3-hydroxy acid dehydrogenase YdfG
MNPNLQSRKKVILITGASSGLGAATASHLSRQGHIVYGVSRSIKPDNKDFRTLAMDVTNENNVKNVIAQIIKEQGKIDVLINNAGIVLIGPVEYSNSKDVLNVFSTNIIGPHNTIRAVLIHMRAQKSGLIINISSIAAANGLPYRGYYSASKAALERITEALRLEIEPFGVQACYIEPGDFCNTNLDSNSVIIDDKNKVYNWQKAREWISTLINKGKNPIKLALLIENIISTTKVKSHYRIGSIAQKLSASLKGILPGYLMEKMIKIYFKL